MIVLFFALIVAGLIPLLQSLNNPRLTGMRAVDRIQLITSGLCFGVALGAMVRGAGKQKRKEVEDN
jgi:hypothetical protein